MLPSFIYTGNNHQLPPCQLGSHTTLHDRKWWHYQCAFGSFHEHLADVIILMLREAREPRPNTHGGRMALDQGIKPTTFLPYGFRAPEKLPPIIMRTAPAATPLKKEEKKTLPLQSSQDDSFKKSVNIFLFVFTLEPGKAGPQKFPLTFSAEAPIKDQSRKTQQSLKKGLRGPAGGALISRRRDRRIWLLAHLWCRNEVLTYLNVSGKRFLFSPPATIKNARTCSYFSFNFG